MRVPALAALAAATSLWLLPHPAKADDPAPAARHSVVVRIAGDAPEREALTRVLLELMQRLSIDLVVEPIEHVDAGIVIARAADDGPYLARCFIDLRGNDHAVLYMHDPARDRILERKLDRAPNDAELVREELG